MNKVQNLKQNCLNLFSIEINFKVFCDKKHRNFWNKFGNAIV